MSLSFILSRIRELENFLLKKFLFNPLIFVFFEHKSHESHESLFWQAKNVAEFLSYQELENWRIFF